MATEQEIRERMQALLILGARPSSERKAQVVDLAASRLRAYVEAQQWLLLEDLRDPTAEQRDLLQQSYRALESQVVRIPADHMVVDTRDLLGMELLILDALCLLTILRSELDLEAVVRAAASKRANDLTAKVREASVARARAHLKLVE